MHFWNHSTYLPLCPSCTFGTIPLSYPSVPHVLLGPYHLLTPLSLMYFWDHTTYLPVCPSCTSGTIPLTYLSVPHALLGPYHLPLCPSCTYGTIPLTSLSLMYFWDHANTLPTALMAVECMLESLESFFIYTQARRPISRGKRVQLMWRMCSRGQ